MLAELAGAVEDLIERRLDEDRGGVHPFVGVVRGGESQPRAERVARRGLRDDLDVDIPEAAFVSDGGQVMRPVARAQRASGAASRMGMVITFED